MIRKILANRSFVIILLIILIFIPGFPAKAQYQVYQWENFETKSFTKETIIIGMKEKISLVDYNQIPNMPPGFRHPEVGRWGLAIKGERLPDDIRNRTTGNDNYLSGICYNLVLERDKIGATGRALFQADFYLPPAGERPPNVAVLAMSPLSPGDTIPKSIYRFGIGGSTRLYFSHVLKDSESATIMLEDKELFQKIPRPGWHRFSIVFEGKENIRCYVDGHETSFSPVKNTSMKTLQLGILLAEFYYDYYCFVDNPSIQWTPEDVPLPDSPYASTWGDLGGLPQQMKENPLMNASSISWVDPDQGWQEAVRDKKPLLVYFQAPKVQATQTLNTFFETEPTARSFLTKHILVKIDVNQLQGGRLAGKFRIFKVPTVILLNSSGVEIRRATLGKNDTWADFSQKLGITSDK